MTEAHIITVEPNRDTPVSPRPQRRFIFESREDMLNFKAKASELGWRTIGMVSAPPTTVDEAVASLEKELSSKSLAPSTS